MMPSRAGWAGDFGRRSRPWLRERARRAAVGGIAPKVRTGPKSPARRRNSAYVSEKIKKPQIAHTAVCGLLLSANQ